MRKNDSVLAVIVALSIIFTTLVTSIDFHGFNKSYYEKEYQKLNTAQQLHMSEEGLFDATFALLDYLKGKRDDIISVSEVNGVEREIFNERETLHMVDVRNLYQGVLKARNLAFVAGIGALILLLIRKRKQQWSNQVFLNCFMMG